MKGIKKVLCLVMLSLVCTMFMLVPISINANAAIVPANADLDISELTPSKMEEAVKKFLNVNDANPNGTRGGRVAFSDSEALMATAIVDYVNGINEMLDEPVYSAKKESFEINFGGTTGEKTSQNVVVHKKSSKENAKQVIFVSSYDSPLVNSSSSSIFSIFNPESDATVYETGAMNNATGAGVLFALMDYYKDVSVDVDLVFLFVGASNYYGGAEEYVYNMPKSERQRTLLVFSFRRFGGDELYIYNEEVETKHGEYLLKKSDSLNLGFVKTPKNMPIINATLIERLPYTHFAMLGTHAAFMQEHIPVASLHSAYYSGMNVADLESRDFVRRSGSETDTFVNLKEDFPQFSLQMSKAATLAVSAVESADFEQVMVSAREEFNNYDAFTKKLTMQFVVIGICVIAVLAAFFVSKHFEQKYPFEPKKPVNLKVAVFGKDYEEEKEGQKIVELKPLDEIIKMIEQEQKDKNDPFA